MPLWKLRQLEFHAPFQYLGSARRSTHRFAHGSFTGVPVDATNSLMLKPVRFALGGALRTL